MTGARKVQDGRSAEEPVLDLERLRRQCLNDWDLAAEILLEFRTQSLSVARRLGEVGGAEPEAGAQLAHRLRGSALAVGAGAVARAAEAVERAGRLEAPAAMGGAEMSQAIASLAEAVAEAVAEIDRLRI